MNTLLVYAACMYTTRAVNTIVDAYVEDYPYMSGHGMALMLPEFHIKLAGVSPGLLSDVPNEGAIVREVTCQP